MSETLSEIRDLLAARVARGSRAPHGDGARIALCVEGGAMRGVISAGMVSALEALGLTHVFDAVYGSSAGAINAAYFLAGQARLGTTIYAEDINNARFIDLRRALAGRPIVDLSFLMDEVVAARKPLDVDAVVRSASPLTVMATDTASGAAFAFRHVRSATELRAALRAGATMPVVAGPPFRYNGAAFLDASLSEPIPVTTAEADGCTHILALLTRPGTMRARPSAFDRWFVAPRLRRTSPALADRYLRRATPYTELMAAIDRGTGPAGHARVHAIRADIVIRKLERSAELLREGAKRGYEAVMGTLAEER
ncbi:MAG: patatin family protein [Vicinamibacterales bacterium]